MSKRCQKEIKRRPSSSGDGCVANGALNKVNSALDAVVGFSNVDRWKSLRKSFSCKTDEEFATFLLDLAENHLNSKDYDVADGNQQDGMRDTSIDHIITSQELDNDEVARDKSELKEHTNNELPLEEKHMQTTFNVHDINSLISDVIKIDKGPETFIDVIKTNTQILNCDNPSDNDVAMNPFSSPVTYLANNKKHAKRKKKSTSDRKKKSKKLAQKNEKVKKSNEIDIRKAPQFKLQVENMLQDNVVGRNDKVANVISCVSCGMSHSFDTCPLQKPTYVIFDAVTQSEWFQKGALISNENSLQFADPDKNNEEKIKSSYSYASVPWCLTIRDTEKGTGIFAKSEIKEFTQFGPLHGKQIKEADIPEDFNMMYLWEVFCDKSQIYFNTEDPDESNWCRFMRPAASRESRNVAAVSKTDSLFFITLKKLKPGEELLYWQDSLVANNKKKMEKTTCGGCNMTFTHPLYYRTHCSIFHDVRYSLTIRKYHCKVCGAAVLGKENIMKHAAELHKGQGAYQCQYCKKFFLRLNYLEMHRTYGCSANPHRSRPLCDFCGRKFCQPQKLKVHIKRMHSDMSEVLKEFQCKNCMKILGSRAALQRHMKEVHQKQMEGACSCIKCGKLFQNKSNLKIHMLTHSGIKPFKCDEDNCNAAFTTKQCLQFHYKKVHGFTEAVMPKIKRSVDYTFEAYSGLDDQVLNDSPDKHQENTNSSQDQTTESKNETEESCDIDESSLDVKNIDDPPSLQSPISITMEQTSRSISSPPTLEPYNGTLDGSSKVVSKGSKKWIGDDILHNKKSDIYGLDLNRNCRIEESSNVSVEVDDSQVYDSAKLKPNLNTFNHHESNASLLVEAALDSVCSESNIEMDVGNANNCADALVNNLYNLSHSDTLPDVTYNHSVDVNDSRDISLISPSVNDHISVTDELNEELRHTQDVVDYAFHQEDFSPSSSPNMQIQQRNNFIRDYIINPVSPQGLQNYNQNKTASSPNLSPSRYNFEQSVGEHQLSSDDSNGIVAQNLSLHSNTKSDVQLDLSVYKAPYLRMKFDSEADRKQVYVLELSDVGKNYNSEDNLVQENGNNEDLVPSGSKTEETSSIERYKYTSEQSSDIIRSKLDLDLDLRIKAYDSLDSEMRTRNYTGNLEGDLRIKNYEFLDALDARNKTCDFEPLILNPAELQGLDMSARGYHNYPNLNRYHHLYSEVDRPSVDLRLNYSPPPPPPPTYTHADILRAVSLDLTPPGRHSVDLSLRTHPLHHQLTNARLLTEHASHALNPGRHLGDGRLISVPEATTNRILSDHTTSRILSNDQGSRLQEESRLLGDGRMMASGVPSGSLSPVQYSSYSLSPGGYHPSSLAPRPHAASPTPSPYHHYSAYY